MNEVSNYTDQCIQEYVKDESDLDTLDKFIRIARFLFSILLFIILLTNSLLSTLSTTSYSEDMFNAIETFPIVGKYIKNYYYQNGNNSSDPEWLKNNPNILYTSSSLILNYIKFQFYTNIIIFILINVPVLGLRNLFSYFSIVFTEPDVMLTWVRTLLQMLHVPMCMDPYNYFYILQNNIKYSSIIATVCIYIMALSWMFSNYKNEDLETDIKKIELNNIDNIIYNLVFILFVSFRFIISNNINSSSSPLFDYNDSIFVKLKILFYNSFKFLSEKNVLKLIDIVIILFSLNNLFINRKSIVINEINHNNLNIFNYITLCLFLVITLLNYYNENKFENTSMRYINYLSIGLSLLSLVVFLVYKNPYPNETIVDNIFKDFLNIKNNSVLKFVDNYISFNVENSLPSLLYEFINKYVIDENIIDNLKDKDKDKYTNTVKNSVLIFSLCLYLYIIFVCLILIDSLDIIINSPVILFFMLILPIILFCIFCIIIRYGHT